VPVAPGQPGQPGSTEAPGQLGTTVAPGQPGSTEAPGQSGGTVAPDGTVTNPETGAPGRPCPTELAETGTSSSGFPTGLVVLGVGALLAGAVALTTPLFPRGRHG
jgi:hypothetical protein